MADPLHPWSLVGKDFGKGIDVGLPAKAYRATVGAHPLIETGALTAGGAAAGYFGAGLAKNLLGGVAGMIPGDTGTQLQEWLADPENESTLRNRLALIGGALGGGYGLAKNLDFGGGLGGAARSMTEAGYWDEPENRKRLLQNRLATLLSRRYRYKKFQWDRGKVAADMGTLAAGDPFFQLETPVRQSLTTLSVDPFLSNSQKFQTQGLLLTSNNGQTAGFTSGHSLMKSALQAGVGFGTAYLFGQVAGRLLSLPSDTVKNLSLVGGLAGALVNTGIFKELGMNKQAIMGSAAAGEAYGAGKQVATFTTKEIWENIKKIAPLLVMAPAAIGVGAGYLSSKMTSPSKSDEEALGSEIETAELQRQVGEIARIRALARQGKQQPPKQEVARGLRY